MTFRLLALASGAFIIVYIALTIVGATPFEAGQALVRGSVGSAAARSGTLREMMPLLLAGLAVFLALRAGLFNIGVEGQLVVGALCSALVAINVGGILGMLLAILAGMAGGALWALPAGLIRAYRHGHEVITTIMLNFVATQMVGYLIAGPLKRQSAEYPTTAAILESTQIAALTVGGIEVSWSLLVALLALGWAWIWLKMTVKGYEFRAVGSNPTAAEAAGISTRPVMVWAMAWSGAIAGVTGALMVLSSEHTMSSAIFGSYGFTALGVALLAGAAPIALILSALLFAALNQGGLDLQDHAPKGIIGIVTGLILIVFAAVRYRRTPIHD